MEWGAFETMVACIFVLGMGAGALMKHILAKLFCPNPTSKKMMDNLSPIVKRTCEPSVLPDTVYISRTGKCFHLRSACSKHDLVPYSLCLHCKKKNG